MKENTTTTIIAVLAGIALLIFTDVRASHDDLDLSVFPTFGQCVTAHSAHQEYDEEIIRIICDGLMGDNDGYDVPKLKTK